MDTNSLGISSKRSSNQSALDKKKKKKRKKKPKEGKRSSASSASASASPDSSGPVKTHHSFSCPSILGGNSDLLKSFNDSTRDSFSKVNECLRWPAHSLNMDNAFWSEVIDSFPVVGVNEEEEDERIAIYKMNRRKRYLAAQQALIKKYPDVTVYASLSGSSSDHHANEEVLRLGGSRSALPSGDSKLVFHSTNASAPDLRAHESQENIHSKYFSDADVALALSNNKGVALDTRQKIFSGI